jgi:hypothetical protein
VVLTHLKRSGGARQRRRFFCAPTIASRDGCNKINWPRENGEDMGLSSNGTTAKSIASSSPRCPRRIVLLREGEDSESERVLLEYQGSEVSGKRLHADVQRLADEYRGRLVAAEWLGPLGWTRFLWCRR